MDRNVQGIIQKIAERNGYPLETVQTVFSELSDAGLITTTKAKDIKFSSR